MSIPPRAPRTPILFYDGECGLCTRVVQFAIRHDRRGILQFAPLQGSTFAALESAGKPLDLSTVVLADDTGLHLRAAGAARLLLHLGGVWSIPGFLLKILPRTAGDALYGFVATRRRKWFGGAESCRMPNENQRHRFLP